jgi:hypothetical protein
MKTQFEKEKQDETSTTTTTTTTTPEPEIQKYEKRIFFFRILIICVLVHLDKKETIMKECLLLYLQE